jgi:GntR family transcriptional regulator, transcriptional repressor for pyruvate dehydrogenase complex
MEVATSLFENLCQLILEHYNRAGTKIPPERVLAAKLKAGRPAIREAIKALSMLEVLESRRGDGTYVKSLTGLRLGWPVKLAKPAKDFDLIELFEVRRMLEPPAAGLAAARAERAHLTDLEAQLRAEKRHLKDYDAFAHADFKFHDAIVRASGNSILISIAHSLNSLLLESRKITVRTTLDLQRIFEQHKTIYEAIRAGQAELAERAMLDHLLSAGLDLISAPKR